MAHWLASRGDAGTFAHVKRFDPRYWSVNFPRPMMASAVSDGAHGLRVDCVFYRSADLAGLIWDAKDANGHPLLQYETARDFRECVLSFGWTSDGLMPLDAVNGPTLTIEGRDADGSPRSWYVRLWNYAVGTPEAARVRIDFSGLDGGFMLPDEAVPVWAGDVDRMFISLVPRGYTGADGMLAAPVEASVTLSDIVCEGAGSVLNVGDGQVPAHDLRMATGYDDLYHLNPARVVRDMVRLGYGRVINHYVGMSHYFRLGAASGGLYVSLGATAINGPCAAWHRAFAAAAKAAGFEIIWSLSYELLDQHCWGRLEAAEFRRRAGADRVGAAVDPAQPGARRRDGVSAERGAGVRRDRGGCGHAGAVPGRGAVVVGQPGRADLSLRRGGEGAARWTCDCRRAGCAGSGGGRVARRGGSGAGGVDGGAGGGGAGGCAGRRDAGAGVSADGARCGGARAGARQRPRGVGVAGVRCAAVRGLRLGGGGTVERERARAGADARAAGVSGRPAALSRRVRAAAGGTRAMVGDRGGRRARLAARGRGDVRVGAAAGDAGRVHLVRTGGRECSAGL